VRVLYILVISILLSIVFVPLQVSPSADDTYNILFYFGLFLRFNLVSFSFVYLHFHPISFIGLFPLFATIILLTLISIFINKLNNKRFIYLGILSIILLIFSIIIGELSVNIENILDSFYYFRFDIYYIIILCVVIMVLGLYLMVKYSKNYNDNYKIG